MKKWVVLLLSLVLLIINAPFVRADGGSKDFNTRDTGLLLSQSDNISDKLGAIDRSIKSLKDTWYADPNWWTAVIALLLGIAGIFNLQEFIKTKQSKKPKLIVDIKLEPPYCLKIAVTNTLTAQHLYDTYYLRFKVENAGDYRMEDVEVVALELYKKGGNNRFSQIRGFLPMNLKWANVGEITMPKIQPHLYKHCDLGHIIQNPSPYNGENLNLQSFGLLNQSSVIFILDTSVTPNTGSNYILPGEYKIKLAFAANNLKPIDYWYKFKIEDRWDNNEHQMLSNNIKVERSTA